jgi:hypothetical protein
MNQRVVRSLVVALFLAGMLSACKQQSVSTTSPVLSSEQINKDEKDEYLIINPCGFLDIAITRYAQQGGDPDKILDDPLWRQYSERAQAYIQKVRAGFVPPKENRCGGGEGPPVPPGFREIPPGDPRHNVDVRIVCLGKKDCERYEKRVR